MRLACTLVTAISPPLYYATQTVLLACLDDRVVGVSIVVND